ncbi:nucleic acid binding, OB-fold, tRNA/helicase-type [Candidatus Koribacter versatilis Ellin345]|uniref:Nucleic acid binding, OB-fold, tRNA/helicase-type n=1 Tax=Koribacter versatilis (strain Ellin345) TaxID=204669 RepID=Q1IQL2_KORVE|nr:nucleic acid-binding protein [Candidatus Koribacter versatilis]ABF40838.1 nucleic acid binding, OB-fold, tRNA/helicase-type [Candidatus Koribacter versatilis Ellin345]
MLTRALLCVALCFGSAICLRADCYPIDKAPEHIGEIVCIRGRVLKVTASASGTHYLNFCENYQLCPFTVVVFPSKLEDIGDVRTLAEQEIEIDGLIKLYQGRPEIVLSEASQIHGEIAWHIPPLPKNYDVARHGNFSAGSFHGKKAKRSKTKRTLQDQADPMNDDSVPE